MEEIGKVGPPIFLDLFLNSKTLDPDEIISLQNPMFTDAVQKLGERISETCVPSTMAIPADALHDMIANFLIDAKSYLFNGVVAVAGKSKSSKVGTTKGKRRR